MKTVQLTFLLICSFLFCAAKNIEGNKPGFGNKPLCFIENKGQVTDQYGNSRCDIQYIFPATSGLGIFVGPSGIQCQFRKQTTPFLSNQSATSDCIDDGGDAVQFDMYRLDMELVGANKGAKIIEEELGGYFEKHFSTDTNNRGIVTRSFSKVTYKDVYPGIDWSLYIKDSHLEYDFIVHPGGNVGDIKIRYNGASGIQQSDKAVTVATPMGTITEGQLFSYGLEDGNAVASRFVLKDNVVGFEAGDYTGTLVIDPIFSWGTYFGGPGFDQEPAICTDLLGNIFMSGITNSTAAIATTGAFQTTIGGMADLYLAKFDPSGTVLWSTYYGGNENEFGFGNMACDNTGNVYINGYTTSTTGIAAGTGAYDTTYGGLNDAYLAKFSTTGSLLWSTYYGGSASDVGTGVACDATGNIYMTGYTKSASGIATAGASQPALAGDIDCFVAKFAGSGALLWATYLGGANRDQAFDVACDPIGNVYMTARTMSDTLIATAGAYQTTHGGLIDALLAKFTPGGTLSWATYYGGPNDDWSMRVTCDLFGGVFIAGWTWSDTCIATAGAYDTVFDGGAYDGYLAKFNTSGAMQWATYFGGSNNDEVLGIVTDTAGYICVVGSTGSPSGIATPGAYRTTISPGGSAYMAQFDYQGNKTYATYYGGTSSDAASDVVCYGTDIFMVGYTQSNNDIASSGTYQTVYADGGSDCFLVKFGPAVGDHVNPNPDPPLNIVQCAAYVPIELYPNPTNDILHIRYPMPTNGSIIITDIIGRELVKQHLGANGNTAIDIPHLQSGIYFFKIMENGLLLKAGKFLKQ